MSKKLSLSQRLQRDPALRAKYLANPGLRSKLPAAYLTPQQRAQREANAIGNAPITDGSSVTNRMLDSEARNAVTTQFGGQRQQLTTEQQRAVSLGRDQGDWYAAYQRELAAHQANTQAINTAATGQIAALGQGIRALDQGQADTQQQAMASDAAIRGAVVDPTLAQRNSDASQVRQQAVAAQGAQQAGLGAAASRYADTLEHVVAPLQGMQARAQSQNRVMDIGAQLAQLARQEGAAASNYKAQRVADEAKTVLSKQALGLDVQKAQTQAAMETARIKETHRSATLSHRDRQASVDAQRNSPAAQKTQQQVDFFNKHGYYPSTGPKTAKSTAAKTAASDKARVQITTAKADAAFLRTQKIPVRGPDGKPEVGKDGKTPTGRTRTLSETEVRAALRKKYKDADVANAAMDLALLGHISPENKRRLQARGIKVPKDWLPKTVRRTGTLGALGPAISSGSQITSKPPIPLGP